MNLKNYGTHFPSPEAVNLLLLSLSRFLLQPSLFNKKRIPEPDPLY